MHEQSLKDKTVKGLGWSAVDNVASYAVTFIVSIVLARLLTPDDYGLLGLISIFTAICTSLISGGFGAAIVRKKECTDDDYNTAFVINLCVSILLYVVIFFCAPLIADFFEREELILLTRVTSVSIVISALSIVQGTRLTKRIDFKTQTKTTLIGSVVSGCTGIIMAFTGFGVWALVAQGIVGSVMRTSLLIYYNRWFPSFSFNKKSFHDLFGFGWKLMISGILDTVWKELYQLVVGKFYSPATLGQYTRAKGFSQIFSSNLTFVIQRVTYPVLSEIQDDKKRMVSAYRRIIKLTMFITFSCMFALGAISEPLIYCLIGEKWHEAATYLPIICFIGAFYPLHAINLNMLQVQGRSDLFLGLEIIKKIIALFPLVIGAFVGIFPMLYASIVTNFIAYFLNSYYSGKLIGYTSWMQIKDITPSFVISMIMAVLVYFLKFLPISNWIVLPIQIVFGVLIFYILCRLTSQSEYEEVKQIILPMYKKINHK